MSNEGSIPKLQNKKLRKMWRRHKRLEQQKQNQEEEEMKANEIAAQNAAKVSQLGAKIGDQVRDAASKSQKASTRGAQLMRFSRMVVLISSLQ